MSGRRLIGFVMILLFSLAVVSYATGCSRAAPRSSATATGEKQPASPAGDAVDAATRADAESPAVGHTADKPEATKPNDEHTPTTPPQAQPSEPAGKPAGAQQTPASSIDSSDSKYASGQPPVVMPDGKPVNVTYRPPSMFSLSVKSPEDKDARFHLTFATMTIEDTKKGRDVEIHFLLRGNGIQPIFRLRGMNIKAGQVWTKTCNGVNLRAKMLDFGLDRSSYTEGPSITWLKVQLTASPAK